MKVTQGGRVWTPKDLIDLEDDARRLTSIVEQLKQGLAVTTYKELCPKAFVVADLKPARPVATTRAKRRAKPSRAKRGRG